MEVFKGLCILLVILLGAGELSEKSVVQGIETNCPIPRPGQATDFIFDHSQVVSRLCPEVDTMFGPKRPDLQTLEEAFTFARETCPKIPALERCLERNGEQLQRCPNATSTQQVFRVYSDLLRALLQHVCSGEGKNLGHLLYGISKSGRFDSVDRMYGKCLIDNSNVVRRTLDRKPEASHVLFHMYRKLSAFQECMLLLPGGPGYDTVVRSTFGVIKDQINCVQPESGSLVPCRSVNVSLFLASSICREEVPVSYPKLEVEGGNCLSGLTKAEEDSCSRSRLQDVTGCLDEGNMKADICLDDGPHFEYGLFREMTDAAVMSACADDGRRLSDVTSGGVVGRCVESARRTGGQGADNNLRLYRQMKEFKACTLEALRDNDTSARSAQWLLDEVMNKAKCRSPTGDVTVLI